MKIKDLFKPIDLTKGKIYKVIIIFMIPIFLSYIFQQIYSLTDAIIVGQNLSSSEVNGVNDVSSLTFIILQFAYGCSSGFSVISSNKIGANDLNGVKKSFITQIVLGFFISLILTILAICLREPLLGIIGLKSGATYEAGKTYLTIIFLGTICQVAYNQICAMLRSLGDSLTPLLFLIGSTILNIGLDSLFIIAFKWGVSGAAIATILSQGLSALACYIYAFYKYPYLRFKIKELKLDFKFSIEHLKLGLPLALQFSILAIGLITLQATIIKFDTSIDGVVLENGSAELAYGAINKLQSFLMCPLEALGTAMLSFCGQNKGSNDIKRIKKGLDQSFIIMFIIYLFVTSLAYLSIYDNLFLKIFYNSENINELAIYLGRINILSVFPFFFILGFLFILRCSIQGIEKPLFPFLGGIGEFLARTLTCLFLPYLFCDKISTSLDLYSDPKPFIATVIADPMAWLFACIWLFTGYFLYVYRPYKKKIREEKLEKEDKKSIQEDK